MATAPAVCVVSVMNRRRVTVSPSKAPGMLRSAVYLDCGSLRVSGKGLECYRSADGAARGRPGVHDPSASAPLAARGQGPDGPRRPPRRPPRWPPRARIALRVRLRAQRDDVGELGDGVEVADRGEPLEAERVQPIAGEQREVRDPPAARRGRRRSAAGSPRGSPRRAAGSSSPRAATASPWGCGLGAVARAPSEAEQAALGAERVGEPRAAASVMRRPPRTPPRRPRPCGRCGRACARVEGNQASNCEAGG